MTILIIIDNAISNALHFIDRIRELEVGDGCKLFIIIIIIQLHQYIWMDDDIIIVHYHVIVLLGLLPGRDPVIDVSTLGRGSSSSRITPSLYEET